MAGAGDVFDKFHIAVEPFDGVFSVDEVGQELFVALFEAVFLDMQPGDADESGWSGEERINREDGDDHDQHPQRFAAQTDVGIGQPLAEVLSKRRQKRFIFIFPDGHYVSCW